MLKCINKSQGNRWRYEGAFRATRFRKLCSVVFMGCAALSASTRVLAFFLQLPDLLERSFSLESRGESVRASDAVPQSEVLPVVVVEEEVVVGVVGRAVDGGLQEAGDAVVSIVDGHGPDVDEDVQPQVGHLVQGEEERVDVVGQALQEAIHRMEGMTGKGAGDLPGVVGLVEILQGGKRDTVKV